MLREPYMVPLLCCEHIFNGICLIGHWKGEGHVKVFKQFIR